MKYDLAPFEALVKEGYLRKSETPDLVLYGYTDQCTFDQYWNEYTTLARGLILEKATGNVVAKCFPKFFNLGEREETRLENLPAEAGYKVHEKMDGSLGIIFYYGGKWNVSTRGSFYSEQAQRAQKILEKYDMSGVPTKDTLLVEIIYPQNRIIVNYGDKEELVLLAVYNRDTGEESGPMYVLLTSVQTGMEKAKEYDLTINQMVKLQKALPKNEEGFVVRFGNGLRVKIKGEEYMRIARILSNMSPLAFWESMKEGEVSKELIAQVPEEFKGQFEPIVAQLELQFELVLMEIAEDCDKLPTQDVSTKEGQKAVGLFIQGNNGIRHGSAIFPVLKGVDEALERYVMKQIRPTNNQLKAMGT